MSRVLRLDSYTLEGAFKGAGKFSPKMQNDCPIQFNTEEHHICIWLSFIAQIPNLSSPLEVFSKKNVLNFFTKIAWKHLQWSHYFNKVGNATLLKKNFSSGALLWILRVFWEQLLCRKPVNGCLYQIDYFFLPF